ncbi:MAG: protein-L-isoaspartate(D-aspartate) O-methyltransferase [Bacteroidales bacterium]|jgi:protein-L-isoaspartate(D-aspartate) O-methyltransferase|nr:protein-L-isoaspartate(D-aspartate) O-methyltransferase [Bacteroidales bacterium]
MIIDTYKHKGLRRNLVSILKEKGITDKEVLNAINVVPRHIFLESSVLDSMAYEDKALPIGNKQTISQPSTVAFQTQLLDIHPNEKILEVGTGSGYQSAILCQMKARVFTIERHKNLHLRAKAILESQKYPVKCFFGDGYKGIDIYAPFDKIIITCGASSIPNELINQLKVGGLMVVPLGEETQTMFRITKKSETELIKEEFGDFKFVPMLKDRVG